MPVIRQCLDGIRETVLQRARNWLAIYLVGVWNLVVEEVLGERFLVARQFAQQRRPANASAALNLAEEPSGLLEQPAQLVQCAAPSVKTSIRHTTPDKLAY